MKILSAIKVIILIQFLTFYDLCAVGSFWTTFLGSILFFLGLSSGQLTQMHPFTYSSMVQLRDQVRRHDEYWGGMIAQRYDQTCHGETGLDLYPGNVVDGILPDFSACAAFEQLLGSEQLGYELTARDEAAQQLTRHRIRIVKIRNILAEFSEEDRSNMALLLMRIILNEWKNETLTMKERNLFEKFGFLTVDNETRTLSFDGVALGRIRRAVLHVKNGHVIRKSQYEEPFVDLILAWAEKTEQHKSLFKRFIALEKNKEVNKEQ